MIGRTLGNRYQIVKLLGSGGFGDTYLAKDLYLPGHPHCVVKHLKPKDPDPAVLPIARRLFETEAQTLYKLGKLHDQIPSLSAHFEEHGEFYLVQDLILGHDLTKELIDGKKLSESYTITLLQNILEILAIVHQQKVIHRDLNPKNLMRRQDGKIVLIDFGAVKEIGTLIVNAQGQTTVSIAIGTAGYMPSEQAKGKPKLCSDIYAVGMIGIQALTGRSPDQLSEDPTTGEVIWRNQAQVSNNLANILDRMVRDHFSQRYQNANEALQAILPLSPNIPGSNLKTTPVIPRHNSPSPIPPTTPSIPSTTRRTVLQLAGFTGLGFVVAVVSQNLGDKSPQPSPSSSPLPDNNSPPPQPSPSPSPLPDNNSPSPSPSPEEKLPPPEKPPSPSPSISLKTFTFEIVTVNSTGQETNRRQGKAKFFTDNLGNGVTIDMISIPGGSFVMGSPNKEGKRQSDEGPQHTVNVAHFFMGKYPITQAQWQAVMENNPSYFKGLNRPLENVYWNNATEFCRKLSKITGRNYRLPSEAEWEYACRAGTTTPFHFGDTITADLVNYDGNNPYAYAPKGIYWEQTKDVGSFPPNAFGLYDMHGNVWEWCQDAWHDTYNGAPSDGSAWESGGESDYRVQRGGSWANNASDCRTAVRKWDSADTGNRPLGFRVALVL